MTLLSILMATYAGEQPARLARSLESMFDQSRSANQLVLVVDGPIDAEQDAVIERYSGDPRIPHMSVIRCPTNRGLAAALNVGLERCEGDWIIRMDSDDIALHARVERQMSYLDTHPEIDLLTGWAEEFFENLPGLRIKSAPEAHDDVVRALRWRNVLVHPSLVIRAATLRRVSGYRNTFDLLEDWELYVRLAMDGARFAVMQEVVIRMLGGEEQARRRGGLRYLWNEARFRTYCWSSGFLSLRQYLFSMPIYMAFRILGPGLRNRLYVFVRRPVF